MEYMLEIGGKNAGQSLVLTQEADIVIAEHMIAVKQLRTEIKRLTAQVAVIAECMANAHTD